MGWGKALAVAGLLGLVAVVSAPPSVSAQGTCRRGFELTAIDVLGERAAKRAGQIDHDGNDNGYVCVKGRRFPVRIIDDVEPL